MKNKLSNDELLAHVESCESSSYGINDAALTRERTRAIDYYTGQPFGNEVEERSQVVSRDVLEVIETALPQLLKVFVSGDEVVRFQARGPEDEDASEQETAAVNYYVMEKNDGFAIFYTWFKDSLLSKNGYIKIWWEEEDETETENYQGLTDDQLALMLQDERIEVIEHTSIPDPIAAQQMQAQMQQLQQAAQQDPRAAQELQQHIQRMQGYQPPMIHDVKIAITETKGCIKIDNVAPEDILVGVNTRTVSLQDASFVQHRALMCKSEIEEQGWDLPESAKPENDSQAWEESNSRDLYDEEQQADVYGEYLVKDTYVKVNGESLRLVIISNTIVFQEEYEIIPFACLTPHIMPHRHIGMSYSDLAEDVQLIKSSLMRGQLDNMYLANNGRYAISDRVNLEDMLTSRPGGVVRVQGEPGAAILPLQHAPFPPTSFTMVEYMDNVKERRTGITAYNQGLDANSLNKTATGVQQIMQAAQQRIELVARTFANTGVKELFMLVHYLVRKYNTRPDIIRLRNEWVTVDPREWKERKDMAVSVGLGTGNKDQQLMHLSNLIGTQMQLLQAGMPVIQPRNIYETLRQIVINSGFKQPEMFVTDPKEVPPQPPQEHPQLTVEKMKLQADAQKFQAETEVRMRELQMQSELKLREQQASLALQATNDERDAQRETMNKQMEAQLQIAAQEQQKAIAEMKAAMDKYTADLEAQTKLQIASMSQEEPDDRVDKMLEQMKALAEEMAAPATLLRDPATGKAVGVQKGSRTMRIQRGPDGRAIGLQ